MSKTSVEMKASGHPSCCDFLIWIDIPFAMQGIQILLQCSSKRRAVNSNVTENQKLAEGEKTKVRYLAVAKREIVNTCLEKKKESFVAVIDISGTISM